MNSIDAYIEYLRNISRKIISKSNFINIFPSRGKNSKTPKDALVPLFTEEPARKSVKNDFYFFNLSKYQNYSEVLKSESFKKYYNAVFSELKDKDDKKLFIASGLVNGKHNRQICAPLIYSAIDVDFDQEQSSPKIEIDYDSLQINHDFIAYLIQGVSEEEEEFELKFDEKIRFKQKFQIFDEFERDFFEKFNSQKNLEGVFNQSNELIDYLRAKIKEFSIIEDSTQDFDFENRNLSEELTYYDFQFFFVANVPSELSTYEALNKLLNKRPIDNSLLKELIEGILFDTHVNLRDNLVSSETIVDLINNKIPFSLSENQILAILNAFQNKISYIQGPPGTGKSFTITILILICFLLNKKVLLVSHKEEAIRVVKKNLDEILGEESILYLGKKDSKNNGVNRTKKYIEALLEKSSKFKSLDFFNHAQNNLETTLEEIKNQCSLLSEDLEILEKKISSSLNIKNQITNSIDEFIVKFEKFSRNYGLNEKETNWSYAILEKDIFQSYIDKYKKIISKKEIERIKVLFLIKFFNFFCSQINSNLEKVKSDHIYTQGLFDLNFLVSNIKRLNLLIKDESNTFQLRENVIEERIEKIQEYLKKNFEVQKIKAVNENNNRAHLENYKKVLWFNKDSTISSKMENIEYDKVTNVLPLWCSELRNLGKYIPLKKEIFDFIVVDEASQVNIAEIIPAFYRGKRFCVVGDHNQLNLNATGVGFSVSKTFDELSWQSLMQNLKSYEDAKESNLLVTESSILDFVNSESNLFEIPSSSLDEHYRSMPTLARFSNTFYDNEWKIMTETAEKIHLNCFKSIKVEGARIASEKKTKKIIKEEMDKVVEIVKDLYLKNYSKFPELNNFDFESKTPSVGVISFLTDQVNFLRDHYLNEEELKKNLKLFIATPEEFQGNERDIIIITLGISSTARWGKAHYENKNRFNVATSRAKKFTYLVYSHIPENATLIKKYFSHFEKKSHLKWDLQIQNSFHQLLYTILEKILNNLKIKFEIFNNIASCGEVNIDFCIVNKISNKALLIETEGKFSNVETYLKRIEVLKRAGWKIALLDYRNFFTDGKLENLVSQNPIFIKEISNLEKQLIKELC